MARNGVYDGATTPVVEPFTKEQRQRLEALTFARKMVGTNNATQQPVHDWVYLADYIYKGAR